MWFWRRFFSFSVLTVSFGLGLDLDSNLFGLGLDSDSNLFGLDLDSDSNLFGLGFVLDSTKVDLTTALLLPGVLVCVSLPLSCPALFVYIKDYYLSLLLVCVFLYPPRVCTVTTGLKIVGTGASLTWCSVFSSFQNSLKTSGHKGYEFLEFWCWNLVPFFSSCWRVCGHIWRIFHLMMCQMFSIDERSGMQAGQFSTGLFYYEAMLL